MFGVAALLPIFASCGYVPEPQPVKSSVEITAVYYPGTDQMSEWDVIAQTCPERKPLLGWFDEGNPEAIDWQIKWAVENGISSFCVDWYWNRGYQRLTHWLRGYYRARYRKYLKWYMMYANHNQPGAHSTADQVAVTKYWLENYFKTPEYYTIDGKPVVCYWDDCNLDRDFIAEAAARGEKLMPGEGKTYDLRLKWGTPENPIIGAGLKVDEVKSVASVPVAIDGQWHEYEVPLAGRPDWTGMVDELWFEACELVHSRVEVDWMRFVPKD